MLVAVMHATAGMPIITDYDGAALAAESGTRPMTSPTRNRIEAFGVWGTLAVYFLVWTAGISNGFRAHLLLLAIITATTYIGMHVFEMLVRGHCLLSADSTAAPVTILVFVVAITTFSWTGMIQPREMARSIGGFTLSFIVGHIAALLYAASVDTILKWLFQNRINAEEKGATGARSDTP